MAWPVEVVTRDKQWEGNDGEEERMTDLRKLRKL
jgi:hypothetical protein